MRARSSVAGSTSSGPGVSGSSIGRSKPRPKIGSSSAIGADQAQPIEPLLFVQFLRAHLTLSQTLTGQHRPRGVPPQPYLEEYNLGSDPRQSGLRANFAFAAIQQAANIGAVHDPEQGAQQQE